MSPYYSLPSVCPSVCRPCFNCHRSRQFFLQPIHRSFHLLLRPSVPFYLSAAAAAAVFLVFLVPFVYICKFWILSCFNLYLYGSSNNLTFKSGGFRNWGRGGVRVVCAPLPFALAIAHPSFQWPTAPPPSLPGSLPPSSRRGRCCRGREEEGG